MPMLLLLLQLLQRRVRPLPSMLLLLLLRLLLRHVQQSELCNSSSKWAPRGGLQQQLLLQVLTRS